MKRKVAKDVLFRVAREDFQTNGFALIPGLHIQNNKDLVKAVKSKLSPSSQLANTMVD